MVRPRLRSFVACFAGGAVLAMLHAACVCDCALLPCDAADIALELPAGDSYSVHITACIDGFDPATVDEFGAKRLDLRFAGEGDSTDTLAIEGSGVTPEPSSLSATTKYTQALCDDGITVTLSNTGATPVAGVLRIDVHADDDGDGCELRLEQP